MSSRSKFILECVRLLPQPALTPHNSWGFEGVKNLPDIPHGLRVNFYNQDKGYQEDETIVYDVGYGEANASLFENITLPGVTKSSLVIDHARWHMAQVKLRPEVYSLNADLFYEEKQKGLTDTIVKVMKAKEIDCFDINGGKLIYSQNKTKQTINKQHNHTQFIQTIPQLNLTKITNTPPVKLINPLICNLF